MEAVEVLNAFKSYESDGSPVINGLNMTIQTGSIYGLLGASGCGKTTMLSCIVGTRKLDRGSVSVFGKAPGTLQSGIPGRNVGYMPQDVSLYDPLTIQETFEYYGRLYGMTKVEIGSKMQSLFAFLDLPSKSRIVGTLSGGQKRRTSLGISLIHDPPLLILDEPTVGVDPLLRESIWNHLIKLVTTRQITVLITTHYIEEARQANTVGLMRGGRLLVESSPTSLLQQFGANLLEEIVLKLCKKDDIEATNVLGVNSESTAHPTISITATSFSSTFGKYPKPFQKRRQSDAQTLVVDPACQVSGLKFEKLDSDAHHPTLWRSETTLERTRAAGYLTPSHFYKDKSSSLSRIHSLTIKNWKLLSRNKILLVFILTFPPANFLGASFFIGREPKGLNFGIVNPEVDFNLSDCNDLKNGCRFEKLSCRYLSHIPKDTITQVSFPTMAEALKSVELGDTRGFIVIPQNYSRDTMDRAVEGLFPSNESLTGSTISLRMDKAHFLVASTIQGNILSAFLKNNKQLLQDCGQDPRRGELPLEFRKPIYGASYEDSSSYGEYVGLAMVVLFLFFLPNVPSVLFAMQDKKQGTLERTLVAGATTLELITANFLVNGLCVVSMALLSYVQLAIVVKVEILGSHLALLALFGLVGLSGIAFYFMLAELLEEEIEIIFAIFSCFGPSFFLCGTVWPTESFPPWLKFVSASLPYSWGMDSMRSITYRGWSIFHPKVWPGLAIPLGWAAFFVMVTIWTRRKK